jgi:thioredoxin 1
MNGDQAPNRGLAMKNENRLRTPGLWLSIALLAVVVVAGCMGRNGMFPWSEPETKDSLEHVTSTTFDERVLKCDKPVLVDFYAEWCGPCKRLTPIVEEFAAEHPEVRVVKVNVDDNPELAKRYGVNAMPTLMVVRNGKVAAPPSVGLVPKSKLVELVISEPTDEKG